MASGTLARPCPTTPGAHLLPLSEVANWGEVVQLVCLETVTSGVPLAGVATSPPLSAKPGGRAPIGQRRSSGGPGAHRRSGPASLGGVASVGRDPARVNGTRSPEPRICSLPAYFSSEE